MVVPFHRQTKLFDINAVPWTDTDDLLDCGISDGTTLDSPGSATYLKETDYNVLKNSKHDAYAKVALSEE